MKVRKKKPHTALIYNGADLQVYINIGGWFIAEYNKGWIAYCSVKRLLWENIAYYENTES